MKTKIDQIRLQKILLMEPCREARTWLKKKTSIREAYDECDDETWLEWLVTEMYGFDRVKHNKNFALCWCASVTKTKKKFPLSRLLKKLDSISLKSLS